MARDRPMLPLPVEAGLERHEIVGRCVERVLEVIELQRANPSAGGEILVSGEFLAALREPVRADRLAELALKGKARAVEVFRLAREAAVSAR